MKSLKECYEIAKKYHIYWTDTPGDTRFMCHAIEKARTEGKLTREESIKTTDDVLSIINAFDPYIATIKAALSNAWGKQFTDEGVKAFWDKYIDNLENQDD